jgi:hypothetical protein
MLDLTDTLVREDALYRLPRFSALSSLDINRLPVGDGVGEALARQPLLRKLELDGTGITDVGLRRLLELNPNLERIELRGTQVTFAAAKELAEAHPRLTIVQEFGGLGGLGERQGHAKSE